MIVDDITELRVVGVYQRGDPNQERIVLQVNETVNMGQFGFMLGVRSLGRMAHPINDNMYWFGDGYAYEGDWIFVYTGRGEARTTELPNVTHKLYTLHWGREKTILDDPGVVPILFRVDAVYVPEEPLALPNAEGQETE